MIKLASKALNSTPLVFFTTFTTLFVTWWNWWLYLIKNLPNSRTLKDHPIEIQIKDELQLSIFSVVPPPNIFSFWPLQRIRLDEYLSFRIIDRRRKEAEKEAFYRILSENFDSNFKILCKCCVSTLNFLYSSIVQIVVEILLLSTVRQLFLVCNFQSFLILKQTSLFLLYQLFVHLLFLLETKCAQ